MPRAFTPSRSGSLRALFLAQLLRGPAQRAFLATVASQSHLLAAEVEGAAENGMTSAGKRSALEESLIKEALERYGLDEELVPEGKTIESVDVYVLEVFDDRDPVPNFVNIFHASTRHWVIKAEVLQGVGEKWDQDLILESERKLRVLRQLSLANVVAARGSSNDKVKLVVVVKDVWSLRLNSDWAYGSNGLDYLLLNPMEENLGGIRASLGARFLLKRDIYSVGGQFTYPRMFGTKYSLGIGAGTTNNRTSGENEGGYGVFSFERPLLSRRTKWAYGTTALFEVETTRKYRTGAIVTIPFENAAGTTEFVPWIYGTDAMDAVYGAVRSFGYEHKFDLGFGLELTHRKYSAVVPVGTSPEVAEAYEKSALPVSDTRINPYLSLSAYGARYQRVLNIESLGLQEDWRLGYGISSTVFVGSEELGSSRDHVGSTVSMGYTVPLSDGLVRAGISNRIVVANLGRHEAFASARARIVSPDAGVGRLHLDAYFGHRYYNYLNLSGFQLGGDNRLRGYAAGAFFGTNLAAFNAEFRSNSVDILSAQVGLAAFYDVGGADDSLVDLEIFHSVGGGFRILFPQADRIVMRLDWGFPLRADVNATPGAFYFTFGQAFSMPEPSGGGDPY